MKKFTLIELLVVVAIIGILASMLLPVLGKARKKSIEVLSKNNLKQIYTGMYMYTMDNDDYAPKFYNENPDRFWSRLVYESMVGKKISGGTHDEIKSDMFNSSYADIMYCPVIRREQGALNVADMHAWGRSDYGINKYFQWVHRKFSHAQAGGKKEPLIMGAKFPKLAIH